MRTRSLLMALLAAAGCAPRGGQAGERPGDEVMAMLAGADTVVETLASIDADGYVVEPAGAR